MLENVLDGIEAASGGLARIVLMQGTKYYGSHLGPFKTPALESDPRHMPPNFYFNQQDLLIERQAVEMDPQKRGELDLDLPPSAHRLRLRRRHADEPGGGHRRLCRDLE